MFFVGDSAGHCLPLTAEGIRTAFYFGIAAGRELRAVLEGGADAREALRALRRVLAPRTRWKFEWMLTLAGHRPAPAPAAARTRSSRSLRPQRLVALGVRALPADRAAGVRAARAAARRGAGLGRAGGLVSFSWAPHGRSEPAAAAAPVPATAVPARRMAVVCCMDARLDPLRALGLKLGDAHVIRNAGAVVTDDVRQSLAASRELAGTTAVVLLAHSDCRAHGRRR